ncbi:hypothetical protein [Rhodococcoides corynebacterioides]|uniref:hypothetical protein n=1 Tax=Rhodococcoides corynebacterioides TaxID=53972 RepID=UPI003AE5A9F7
MQTDQLIRIISDLPSKQPVTDGLELVLVPTAEEARTFSNQREHLLGWLRGYNTPGRYGRQRPGQDAKFFYNHFRNAPGLIWLAEALGEDRARLEQARDAVLAAAPNRSSQCAAVRRVIPWSRIEELVVEKQNHSYRRSIRREGVATRFLGWVRWPSG